MQSFDLYTVKKEDLAFSAPFSIVASRNDNIHAIVAYFDIEFTKAHKPVFFSTGPRSRYTHWKQTVFYLPDVIPVNEGEKMTGTLTCKPNAKNPRDLDIDVSYQFKGQHLAVSNTMNFWLR